MFAKPYKLKSNNTLKNSEKKHLAQRFQDEFTSVTEENVKELVPAKSSCICMKLVLYAGDIVNVYAVDGVPMVIETAEGLVPTVCALWKVPQLVPNIVIHTPVLPKMQGGAPLYLPGVTLPAGGVGFPLFQRGTIIAAVTTDNMAAGVVGRTTMSSADMLLRAAGVCLDTLHTFGDQLCKDAKFSKIERPKLGPPSYSSDNITESLAIDVRQLKIQSPVKEEWPALGKQQPQSSPVSVPNEPKVIADAEAQEDSSEDQVDVEDSLMTDESQVESDIPTDMDGLLQWCLLSFLKLEGKSVELPLKTSLFYRNHLIPLCPSDRTLDVKKSTFKKMSKFLEAMQKEGLLEVRELEKGVDAVVALSVAHPSVRAHALPAEVGAGGVGAAGAACGGDEEAGEEYTPPRVREMFCVTAAVADLMAPLKKGTALTSSEVRAAITEYVRVRNLQAPQGRGGARGGGGVALDATLAKIVGKQEQECVPWETLMSGTLGRMTAATEMRFADGTLTLSKAKLEPVKMQVVTRSGNKKVTLVSHLPPFGFRLAALARAAQRGVGAACGVTRTPGARDDQLMLQGDQTHFVAKLLIEKYGLPKKFVEGADKALNKKK